MGFLDRIKSLFRGRETQVKTGIDKASDAVEKAVPDQHDAKVEQVAEKAKDVVDDFTKADDAPSAPAPASDQGTPPPATP